MDFVVYDCFKTPIALQHPLYNVHDCEHCDDANIEYFFEKCNNLLNYYAVIFQII